jgi:riboflavin kinase/FMN adenylyltransferase
MHLLPFTSAEKLASSVVTVGTFDGVHLGHKAILAELQKQADSLGLPSVVVTFDPLPKAYFTKKLNQQIYTLSEKINKLDKTNLDYLLVIPFSGTFAALSYRQFVEQVLVDRLGARVVVVGYDHKFGNNKEGGAPQLEALGRECGFTVVQTGPLFVGEEPASSTRIREALLAGNLSQASFPVSGTVVRGDQLGRRLGFPTANLAVPDEKLLPRVGVYCGWARLQTTHWPALLSIGYRPTVNGTDLRVEVYVMGFRGDLYGQHLQMDVTHWLRGEEKFETLDALVAQMHRDETTARQLLRV